MQVRSQQQTIATNAIYGWVAFACHSRHAVLLPTLEVLLNSEAKPPNAQAKLPGPPTTTMKPGKPEWRP
jgi:hypothetical protein